MAHAREKASRDSDATGPGQQPTTPARTRTRAPSRSPAIDPEGALWRMAEGLSFALSEMRKPAEDALAEFQLGLAHHRTMTFIYKRPGITSGELRRVLDVSNQALQKVLGSLIRRGFVEQVTGTEDRRIRHLHLTDSGRAVFEPALRKQFEILENAALAAGKEAVRGFLALTDSIATAKGDRPRVEPLNEAALAKLFPDQAADKASRKRRA